MAVSADGASGKARRLGQRRRTNLESLDWNLPADFGSLSITFHRLDTAPCAADVAWESYGLFTDQLFNIRSRLAEPTAARPGFRTGRASRPEGQ
jgi:hypothetical protein